MGEITVPVVDEVDMATKRARASLQHARELRIFQRVRSGEMPFLHLLKFNINMHD